MDSNCSRYEKTSLLAVSVYDTLAYVILFYNILLTASYTCVADIREYTLNNSWFAATLQGGHGGGQYNKQFVLKNLHKNGI